MLTDSAWRGSRATSHFQRKANAVKALLACGALLIALAPGCGGKKDQAPAQPPSAAAPGAPPLPPGSPATPGAAPSAPASNLPGGMPPPK